MEQKVCGQFESGDGRNPLLTIYLLIGFVSVVTVGSMGFVFHLDNRMVAGYAPQINAATEIKLEATTAHLWFEELISGDRYEDIENILRRIDRARWYAQVMLGGGESADGRIVALRDPRLRREIGQVQDKLDEFANITNQRWQARNGAGIGSETDQQYDAVFRDFVAQADLVEADLQRLIARELTTFRVVQAVLIATCLTVTVAAGTVFGRFVRRRIRDEMSLRAANQQLKASEQQLRAANQQLHGHEQQLRASNQQLAASEQQLRAANQQLLAGAQELRRERDRAQRYLDVAAVMLVVIDSKQQVALINRKGCEILGYDQDEILGKNWFECFLPERVRDEVKMTFEKLISGDLEPVEYYENPVLRKDGVERLISWHNTVLRNDEGRIICTLSSGADITEQKKRADELAEYRNQLRSLVSELTIAEDRERKNIASLLHDDVLQKLTMSNMELSMLREMLTTSEQLGVLDSIRGYVNEMFEDMRSLTFDLCPPILYDIGLEAAVRDWLEKEMAGKHGIDVNFESEGRPLQLREDVRVALYRAIREVLMNVIKHARARRVSVTLVRPDDTVRVEVCDDGIGFERAGAEAGNKSSRGPGLVHRSGAPGAFRRLARNRIHA